MKIVPLEVLARESRETFARQAVKAPEPRVINARAWAKLDAPRSLVWGGIGYWCPPLSYENGMKLLIAANALRDLRERGGSDAQVETARFRAARLIRSVLDRRRRPLWRWWSRAFFTDEEFLLEALIRDLLHVEDDSVYVPPDRPFTVDLVDNLYTFNSHFGRRPDSWKDYVYGMRHISRDNNRAGYRTAVSSRMGVNSDKEAWQEYERDVLMAAGWN